MTASDIERRAAFTAIRYAQVWEDADILVEALRLKPSDTAVSIASAGDNAFAMLAEGCEQVIAVDLSPAQLACVRLRSAAYARLTHEAFLELIGSRASTRRRELLRDVAQGLPEDDQRFWAERADAVSRHGAGGIGKFETYFRVFRDWVLPFIHNRETIDRLLQPRRADERAAFFDRHWNVWGWRALLRVFFSRTVMGRLGRDPAFFDHVEGSVSDQVARLTRKALVDQDPAANPYLHWILKGCHGSALPRALREEHFDAIRTRLDRLDLRLEPLETLVSQGVQADAFNLSDIFEYMSPEAHEGAYAAILSAARPGARLVYWNMMAPRRAPKSLSGRVRTDTELEARLRPLDKAFFYSDFIVEEVR